jgi:FkbM family methyltransferase
LNAQRRAQKLGVRFYRRITFKVPSLLYCNKVLIKVATDDEGSKGDFINIFLDDCYQLEKIKARNMKQPVVVDVGANVGLFCIAARNHLPTATIYAYEPNGRIVPLLAKNTERLDVRWEQKAVGGSRGRVSMIDEGNSNRARTASDRGSVEQITLEDVVERVGGRIDVLKLDCEGAEWGMLQDEQAWRNVSAVTMEYHCWAKPGSTHGEFADELRRLGFVPVSHRSYREVGMLFAVKGP